MDVWNISKRTRWYFCNGYITVTNCKGVDYIWRQSNALGRAQRKDTFVPPTSKNMTVTFFDPKDAKLSTLVPSMNTPQLLGAVEKLKPGQYIRILVNDWTQDMYHFCLVQGRVTKVTKQIILIFDIFSYIQIIFLYVCRH
jgi:hypothetical protein